MEKTSGSISTGLSIEQHAAALRACVDLMEWKGNVELCIGSIQCADPIDPFNVMKGKVLGELEFIEETIEFLTQHITEMAQAGRA